MNINKSVILTSLLVASTVASAVSCSSGSSGVGRETDGPSDNSASVVSSDLSSESASESFSESSSGTEYDPPIKPPTPDDVVVSESSDVGNAYFSDALFIGDSLTTGFSLYSVIESNFYANVGLSTLNIRNDAFVNIGGVDYTVLDALRQKPDSFKKIYVSMGINELYRTASAYKSAISGILAEIRAICPDAVIYVQSMLPMSASASSGKYAEYGGNEKIAAFNSSLLELCRESGYYYVDVFSVMSDGSGALPDDFTGADGIHLKPAQYQLWAQYLRTHAIAM